MDTVGSNKLIEKLRGEESKCVDNGVRLSERLAQHTKDLQDCGGLDSAIIEKIKLAVSEIESNNKWHTKLVDALDGPERAQKRESKLAAAIDDESGGIL